MPGGSRSPDGSCYGEGQGAGWWSATAILFNFSYSHWVIWNRTWIHKSDMLCQTYGLNVRCVKDQN
jgi:hypothetical protein